MKNITGILSSFDEKFGFKQDLYSQNFKESISSFLKDSIIEILEGIPLEEKKEIKQSTPGSIGNDFRLVNNGYNLKCKELREYIEKVKL